MFIEDTNGGDVWIEREAFATILQSIPSLLALTGYTPDEPAEDGCGEEKCCGGSCPAEDATETIDGKAMVRRVGDFVHVTMSAKDAMAFFGFVEFASREGLRWSTFTDSGPRWLYTKDEQEPGDYDHEGKDWIHEVGAYVSRITEDVFWAEVNKDAHGE